MKDFSREYFKYLSIELAGINLISIKDQEEFYVKQVLDSIASVENSVVLWDHFQKHRKVVDIGFGGGFPILPMAYKYPNIEFVGLEARNKKVEAVKKIVQHFKIKNVKLYHKRVEELDLDVGCAVVMKAVGTLSKMLNHMNINQDVGIFFLKGRNFIEKEGKDLETIRNKWDIIENRKYKVETFERYLVGLKSRKVPRGTKRSDKLSNLFGSKEN